MFHLLGRLSLALALLAMAGGHWAALQGVAWTRMILEFARSEPLAAAIGKTLGGEHPCSMCQAVEKGREQERKAPATVKTEKQPELAFRAANHTPVPVGRKFAYPRPLPDAMPVWIGDPPQPVPRKHLPLLIA